MARMVGLSRNLKPAWLNKAAELAVLAENVEETKEALNEYLGFEISSAINIRKTRELLLNTWYYQDKDSEEIRELALRAFQSDNSNKIALHWCLMLLNFPVFAEVCSLIGKISTIQEEFTVAWLKERLFEAWGERSTLFHSVDKIMKTITDLGAVKRVKTGAYHAQKTHVTDDETLFVIVKTILKLKEKAYYEPNELSSVSAFFPFDYQISHHWVHQHECFQVGNFGGKMVLVSD